MKVNRMVGEVRSAARGLGRNPRLASIMVLTLALGLGANTTIFSLVKSVLFAEADFGRNTGRVISLHSMHPTRAQQLDDAELSWPEFEAVRSALQGVEQVEGFVERNFTLSVEEGAVRANGASVTPGLFSLIDAKPALGRALNDSDASDFGFESSVVISHALWQRQYGSDPHMIGRRIPVNGRGLEVVGIMPRGFAFPEHQELWVAYKPGTAPANAARFMTALGLLAPGEDVASVSRQLEPLSLDLDRRLKETQLDYRMQAARFPNSFVGGTAQAMSALLLAVVMVLLIQLLSSIVSMPLSMMSGLQSWSFNGGQDVENVRAALNVGNPWVIANAVVEAIVAAMTVGIMYAPFSAAYRDITGMADEQPPA